MTFRKSSPDLQRKAEKELNEIAARIPDDLKHIKGWLAKQPHINARTDDQWLLQFLRGSKFSLERTKEKLELFYTMRSCVPEFFDNRDPMRPEIQAILKLGLFLPLPKPNEDGERVILIRLGGYDTNQIDAADIFKTYTLIVDLLVKDDDNFIIAGVNGVVDMRSGNMEHYTHFSPSLIRKIMKCLQNAYPVRPKGLFFINAPGFFEIVHNLFRNFLTEKLRERMKVFSDPLLDTRAVPLSVLPTEYGGQAGSVEEIADKWKKQVESHRDWFLDDAKYRADEKSRSKKKDILGTVDRNEGSFRKLEVD